MTVSKTKERNGNFLHIVMVKTDILVQREYHRKLQEGLVGITQPLKIKPLIWYLFHI